MISWYWVLVAGWAGAVLGFLIAALFAVNKRGEISIPPGYKGPAR